MVSLPEPNSRMTPRVSQPPPWRAFGRCPLPTAHAPAASSHLPLSLLGEGWGEGSPPYHPPPSPTCHSGPSPLVILRSEATKNLRPWPRLTNVRRFLSASQDPKIWVQDLATPTPARATSPFPRTPPIPYPSPMPTTHAPVHTGSSFLRRQSLPLRRQGNLAPGLIPLMPSLSDYHPRSAEGPLTLRLSKGEPGGGSRQGLPYLGVVSHPPFSAPFPYLRLPAIRFAHPLRGVCLLSAPDDSNPPPRNKPQAGAPLRRPFEPNESKLPRFHRKSTPESAPRHPRHGGAAKTRWDESNRLECPPHPSRRPLSDLAISALDGIMQGSKKSPAEAYPGG